MLMAPIMSCPIMILLSRHGVRLPVRTITTCATPRRAAIPAFTACGAVFIDNRAPSRHEFVALSVLMTGVAIAVWDSSSSSSTLNGVVMCLLGGCVA